MSAKVSPAKYLKSPAIEVIFHVQTALPQVGDMEAVKHVLAKELKGFASSEPFNLYKQTVGNSASGAAQFQVEAEHAGFKYTDKKNEHVVHMLRNGLVVNWLKPYPGYTACMQKLKGYWKTHEKAFQPAQVERISLRYINQFDLPVKDKKLRFSEFLNVGPRLPKQDGIKMRGFHQVLDLVNVEKGINGRTTLMSLPPQGDKVTVVFDIESSLHPSAIGPELWKGFDALHEWSHDVFNLSLNEKCRDLFD
ncbi:MAG: TIGR04255 family protein [Flavobacteriales bacterium]